MSFRLAQPLQEPVVPFILLNLAFDALDLELESRQGRIELVTGDREKLVSHGDGFPRLLE